MLTEKIRLWDDCEEVVLATYIPDDSKEYNTGKKRPAVIVCPGGGNISTSDREAEPVALRFLAQGYNAFVLRYTTYFSGLPVDLMNMPAGNEKSVYPQPLFDLAKAILTIRQNAEKWLIDKDKIVICGFSAGAQLAANMGVHWQDDLLEDKFHAGREVLKPNALILGYPLTDYLLVEEDMKNNPSEFKRKLFEIARKAVFGSSEPTIEEMKSLSPVNFVSANTPPTFLWHTANDNLVNAMNSLRFASTLAEHNVPYELHVFENGVHGLSLCDEITAADPTQLNPQVRCWFDLAVAWLEMHF